VNPRLEAVRAGVRAHRALPALLALLPALLTACPEPVKPEYRLTTILPSPVTPGDTVTAFGWLPETLTATLDNAPLTLTPVPDGVRFTVPNDAVAGDLRLRLEGDGSLLEGLVGVKPRLDRVQLTGSSLRITGAGWPTSGVNLATASGTPLLTRVLVEGLEREPSLENGTLVTGLPVNLPFGPVRVSVRVGDRSSEAVTVNREAGSAQGIVNLPASPPPPAAPTLSGLRGFSSPRSTTPSKTATSLIVFRTSPLSGLDSILPTLEGVTRRDDLPSLNATRLTFASPDLAQIALSRLDLLPGFSLEWDQSVGPQDGLHPLSAPAPVTPGQGQWFLALEGIPDAWNRSMGEGVTVAVVDTGVNLNHPDLQPNLLPGWDFIDGDALAQDIAGHGTHVAGLVAAAGQASGVAPRAKIVPVRVLRDLSGGSSFPVAQGILWAAGLLDGQPNPNPARVINLSLGSEEYSDLVAQAVLKALNAGVIVVAAAGNNGSALTYPAALPGVVAVTALAGPQIAYQPWYASRGAGLWVTAYGGDTSQDQDRNGAPDGILSTDLTQSGYGLRMGTSMASPQVAGLAALALSSGTPSNLVRSALANTASDLGPMGFDARYGYGLISGRLGLPSSPRVYAVALDANGKAVNWTVVQSDGRFTLTNLNPASSLEILAASDGDGDGIVGEAGELISSRSSLQAKSGETVVVMPISLNPSGGTLSLKLE
jgi:subtilisin family serine protease